MSEFSSSRDGIGLSRVDSQKQIALVAEMANGDQSALAVLYDQTSRLVFGLALRVLRDRATAEEVLLDVYKQAWRQAALYDAARGTPTGWLLKIAHSRAVDRVRSVRREQDLKRAVGEYWAASAIVEDPEEAAALSEQQRHVRSALDLLPPEQREVVVLAYYCGMSQSEIAERLNLPLGTVKTRARLGMSKLRDLLAPLTEGAT
jgi:RNA polymerase sigma-70 factor, ECF subfamily